MSSDGSWDEDNYEDEFELEESLDQVPVSPEPVAGTPASNHDDDDDDDEEDDDYEEYDDFENEEEVEERNNGGKDETSLDDSKNSLKPPKAVSSPRQHITDRGRGRHASLLSLGLPSVESRSPVHAELNLPTWGDSGSGTSGEQERQQEKQEKQQQLRTTSRRESLELEATKKLHLLRGISMPSSPGTTLNLPTWGESGENEESSSAGVGAAVSQPRFNRDLTNRRNNVVDDDDDDDNKGGVATGGKIQETMDSSSSENEYLSPSTSAAVAAMMKESWTRAAAHKKSPAV